MMKVLALRERFSHMGAYSGYDQLFTFIEENLHKEINLVSVYREEKFKNFIERKLYFKLFNNTDGTAYYTLNSFKAEVSALLKGYKTRKDVIHIAYLENNYGLAKYYKKLSGTKVIATAHQPASWWNLGTTNPLLVEELDGLIVLDSASKLFFSSYLDNSKIHVVRHGVNTSFFTPSTKVAKKAGKFFKCLFAGVWLRDMDLLNAVINYINSKESDRISFHLIYPAQNRLHNWNLHKLASNDNVFWYDSLSDEQLRTIYQNSDIFLIPLIDCTANNAILEAMACGLPIVSTPVSGIKDYVNGDFAFLSKDPQILGDHILSMLESDAVRKQRGEKAREHVCKNLSWEVIAEEIECVYHNVLNSN